MNIFHSSSSYSSASFWTICCIFNSSSIDDTDSLILCSDSCCSDDNVSYFIGCSYGIIRFVYHSILNWNGFVSSSLIDCGIIYILVQSLGSIWYIHAWLNHMNSNLSFISFFNTFGSICNSHWFKNMFK